LPEERFTPQQIRGFQLEVALGASRAEVARRHAFSPALFRRWEAQYGSTVIYSEPTEEHRQLARSWSKASSLAAAWKRFRVLNGKQWPDGETDCPPFDDEYTSTFELDAREDARWLVILEKDVAKRALLAWSTPSRPSAAHRHQLALALQYPVSEWSIRQLHAHAKASHLGMAYFGDLDPGSVHRFAAIRAGGARRLHEGGRMRHNVQWLGVGDALIRHWSRRFGWAEVPASRMIKMRLMDREYWELVKRLVPDVRDLVGRRSYGMLERGFKLEVDAFLVGEPPTEALNGFLRSGLRRFR
jgi:hypothetical protein